MPLPTDRLPGEIVEADDVNEIAQQVNTNEVRIDTLESQGSTYGTVTSVNGVEPDESGNVVVSTAEGTVTSVNGVEPDESGNVVVSTADWNADMLAIARGFHEVLSETEPTETTYTASNSQVYPVVWIRPIEQLVPIVPTEPIWDLTNGTVAVPDLVGLFYRFVGGATITPGSPVSIGPARPQTVQVEAIAEVGYYLPQTYTWTRDFPDPNQITLLTSSAFTVDGDPLANNGVPGLPFDNTLGGTQTVVLTRATGGANVEGNEHFIASGGQLIVSAGTKDNTWVYGRVDNVENIRLEFDVVALPAGNLSVTVAIRAGGFYLAGGASVTLGTSSPAMMSIGAHSPGGPPPSLNLGMVTKLGTWKMQYFGTTFSATDPDNNVHVLENTDVDFTLDRYATYGSDYIVLRTYAASAGVILDNFKVSQIGF